MEFFFFKIHIGVKSFVCVHYVYVCGVDEMLEINNFEFLFNFFGGQLETVSHEKQSEIRKFHFDLNSMQLNTHLKPTLTSDGEFNGLLMPRELTIG